MVIPYAAQLQPSLSITTYKTYDDYINKNGVNLDGKVISFLMGANTVMKLKKDDGSYAIQKFNKGDFYAISEKNNFFRIDSGYPLQIISVGKIVYYEDGNIALNASFRGGSEGRVLRAGCWFSETLESEAFTYKKRKSLKLIKEANSELGELVDCVMPVTLSSDANRYLPVIRECVKTLN